MPTSAFYIDNLFVEGMLRPVSHGSGHALRGEWAAVGVRIDPDADRLHRLRRLAEAVGATIPESDAHHREWLSFAYRWAELGVLLSETAAASRADSSSPTTRSRAAQSDSDSLITGSRAAQSYLNAPIADLRTDVDRAFLAWIERRYAGLHNQPPAPPVMVHHLPRFLARRLADDPRRKAALVVVDGLALDQWIVLRDALAVQRPGLRFREGAAFAWAPTITSVSRQAIFAGTPPLHFPASILTTDREASRWTRFWSDQGLAARETGYAKGLGDGLPEGVRELVSRPAMRALGLVVDKVDKIMHGMALGAAGMHNQVRQWAGEGFMAGLLDALLDGGFAVFLTSDHGNVEAEGRGPARRRRDRRGPGRTRPHLPRRGAAVPGEGTLPGRDRNGLPWGFPKTAWRCSPPAGRPSYAKANASSGMAASRSKRSSSRWWKSNGWRHEAGRRQRGRRRNAGKGTGKGSGSASAVPMVEIERVAA